MELFAVKHVRIPLYRKPFQIGDMLEINEKLTDWLIIGIQSIDIRHTTLHIGYVCQNIERKYDAPKEIYSGSSPYTVSFDLRIETGKTAVLKQIELGRVFKHEDVYYQTREYMGVRLEHTDIIVSLLGEPLVPVNQEKVKKAKKARLKKRMKVMNLELL